MITVLLRKVAAVCLTAVLAAGLLPAAVGAEETQGEDLTTAETTAESVKKVRALADGLAQANTFSTAGGHFTWDTENKSFSWTYYNGIMMKAFLMLDEEVYWNKVLSFYITNVNDDGQVNKTASASQNYYRTGELDSIPPARVLFDLLRGSTTDPMKIRFRKMVDYVYSVMLTYAREATIPGTDGNFRHKYSLTKPTSWDTYQIGLDGLYMAQPFFMELAKALQDGILTEEHFRQYSKTFPSWQQIYKDVCMRILWIGNNMYDEQTHLYNHGWGPDVGVNGQFWLRSVGWYAAALADVISLLPEEGYVEYKEQLIAIAQKLFDGMMEYQDPETGMWYNVINYGPELVYNNSPAHNNRLESSGSALMAYAMLKMYTEGYIGNQYGKAGLKAFNGTVTSKMQNGSLEDVYISSGVMTVPEGYLTKEYRINEAKGVGPLMMAAVYAEDAAEIYNKSAGIKVIDQEGNAVKGVTFQLLDASNSDNPVIAEWVTAADDPDTADVDESIKVIDGLHPDIEYTLRQADDCEGLYAAAEDKLFTIERDGMPVSASADINISEDRLIVETITALPRFNGNTLVLSGQLGLNFYMHIPEEFKPGSYMYFTVTDKNGKTRNSRVDFAEKLLNEEYGYRFTCPVNSIEMADTIKAEFFYTKDGQETCLSGKTTIKDYIAALLTVPAYADAYDLAKTVHNYGYYAQLSLPGGDKHVSMQAPTDRELPTSGPSGYWIGFNDSDLVTQAQFSLVLDSETAINFYLQTTETIAENDIRVEKKDAETEQAETVPFVLKDNNGWNLITISDIPAHQLGDRYTVYVKGEKTVSASPLSYVQSVLAEDSGMNENTKNTALALYDYYKEAVRYKALTEAGN